MEPLTATGRAPDTSAKKGVRLAAAGSLEVSEYTDADGNTRARRRITAEHVGTSTRFTPTNTATR